jgi:hypothetical protein
VRSGFCTFDAELSTVNSQQELCAWSVHAGSLEMQTHQECPPRRITRLECTLTNNDLAGSLECPLTNSLHLKSPGIRASWPFGGAEALWRPATPVSLLECALTKNALANLLEYALTELLDLKPFRFRTYNKPPGGPLPFTFFLLPLASLARAPDGAGQSTAGLEVRPEPPC